MKKYLVITLGLVLGMFILSIDALHAQDEDLLPDDFLEEDAGEVICIPEDLTTTYDKFANDSISDLDIRQKYNFGSEHFKNKNYKEALGYLWTVFMKDQGQFGDGGKRARLSITKIAQIYYEQQKIDSTLIVCYRGLERFDDQIRLHYYAGFIQESLGKFRCAIPHYEVMVSSDSTNYYKYKAQGNQAQKMEASMKSYISNLKKLAFFYFKDENEMAIKVQEKVVELDPTNADEANTLAQFSEYFFGAGAGLEHFEQAYQNNPDDLAIAFRYGKAAVQGGEYRKAIDPLTRCIANKKEKQTLALRATAYENLNELTNAINDYKAILDVDPKDADVMLNISYNYSSLNNFDNSNYWINRALKARPGYGLAYITRGELFEMAVLYCQNKRGKDKYEDKLVYERAYAEYQKARRDPAFISKAKTKQNNLKPFLPTKEDKFMHKGDKITSACYGFMK
jgi:tetratricopeptide (TPR) repeat protein